MVNSKVMTPAAVQLGTKRYAEYRGQISDGDVLCFSGRHWLSRFIQYLSHGRYSHGGLAFWWEDRLMVLQAVARPGVQALPASRAIAQYDGDVDWYPLALEFRTDKFVTDITEVAMDRIGDPYSLLDLVRVGLHYLVGTGLPKEKRSGHRFVCSQYVAYCYSEIGLDLKPDRPDIGTTPEDLARSPYHGKAVRLKGR